MKKLLPWVVSLSLLFGVSSLMAQDTTTTTTTTTAETSNVAIFFVGCETEFVMNLSGTMEAGYDIYYQVFSGAGATGEAVSSVRRVNVNGSYAFSERINYTNNFTLGAGATASARVSIAREGSPDSTIYTDTVNDLQDGCSAPQNPTGSSEDAGGGGTGAPVVTSNVGILSPFGGVINGNFLSATPQPPVVIGAPVTFGRSDTPGVIFAECNDYETRANPGIIYDTDNITIFWSWFARTPEQVEDHIFNANYNIRFNTAPLEYVEVSPITQRTDNYWVFYTANLGNLTPGRYGIEFRLTWDQDISDGFDDYGPTAPVDEIYSNCSFEVQPNPFNVNVTNYNLMYSRPQ